MRYLLIIILFLFASQLYAAGGKQRSGRNELVATEIWQVFEATSVAWQCHTLTGLVGIAQTANTGSRSFGIAVENIADAGQPGVCFAPSATAATIGARDCTSTGVLVIESGLLGPISLDINIRDYCWRSESGTPIASFTATW